MRCKHLIRVADLCRGSVSKLNGGGYRLEVVENTTFIFAWKCLLDQLKLSKNELNNGWTMCLLG